MRRRFLQTLFALLLNFPFLLLAQTPFWDSYDTQNSMLPSDKCQAITFDNHNNLWVATSRGLAMKTDSSWELPATFEDIGLNSNHVSSVAFYGAESSLWAGTPLYGVFKLDSGNWAQQGVPFTGVNDMYCDLDNFSIWVASESGLRHFDGTSWEVYNDSTPRFPSLSVKAVQKDNVGQIWVGTHPFANYPGGLARFDGTTWYTLNRSNGLPNVFINDFLFTRTGVLWIASNGGVIKYSGGNWQTFTPSNSALPNAQVNTITMDGEGNVWAGTEGGIGVFTPKGWTNFLVANSGLPDNRVNDIVIASDGTAWIATEGGLAHFDKVINTSTGISESLASQGHILTGPYPNPLQLGNSIQGELELAKSVQLTIDLFDWQGRKIAELENRRVPAGSFYLNYKLEGLVSAGVYLLKIQAGDAQSSKKIIIE